ncbi:MAG TPA: hypothetical protein VH061_10295 [Solirubrobacteraceae bacterium]|nr:hypothetical protein [Solirubrobacteraceae bacterium]
MIPGSSLTDGPDFLSSRGPDGWTTKNLIPPQSTSVSLACLPYMIAWSANLERGVLSDGYNAFHPRGTNCGTDEPELVSGEPRDGAQNLFVRESSSDTYQLVDQKGLKGQPGNAIYQAGSSDLGLIVFAEEEIGSAEVAPEVTYYAWSGGVDRLLTVLPNGQPTKGEIVDPVTREGKNSVPVSPTFSHAVAPNGSRVEFTGGGKLYSRINPGAAQSILNEAGECDEPSKACTVELDSSQTSEPSGQGAFAGGSGLDGSVVYFTDVNRLTSDATATTEAPDLYEYDFSKPVGERLTDLTVDHNAGEHADVLGYVGTNETGPAGNYVYFVASGVLASNQNSSGALAAPGAPNLYAEHGGSTSFVATLSATGDSCDWENVCMAARVSSNGRYLGFDSLEELTGFANTDAQSGQPDQEIFLYDGEAEGLSCASCGEAGVAPIAPAIIRLPEGVTTQAPIPLYLQRNVSDSGQVFFDTPNPLVANARNSQSSIFFQSNVYEYRAGELNLLSTGTAESSSFFYEASSDGNDVYLITVQGLVPGASPTELSLYDARVDGGFPAPPKAAEPCVGEACSGAQTPLVQPPSNGSEGFSGPGNLSTTVSAAVASVKLTAATLAKGRGKIKLKLKVTGSGQIVAKVKGGRTLKRKVTKAGTYVLQIPTTAGERKALTHHRHLTLNVTYTAPNGTAVHSTRTISA